jgi:hypothetical protein
MMRWHYLWVLVGLGGCAQLTTLQDYVSHQWVAGSQTAAEKTPAGTESNPESSAEKHELPAGNPASVPTVAANAAPAPVFWKMVSGQPFSRELSLWGTRAGWTVVWSLDHDWIVPAATQFDGSFQEAASAAINTLLVNGVLLRATFFAANKTLLVSQAGALNSQE